MVSLVLKSAIAEGLALKLFKEMSRVLFIKVVTLTAVVQVLSIVVSLRA